MNCSATRSVRLSSRSVGVLGLLMAWVNPLAVFADEQATLSGYVLHGNGAPLAGSAVTFFVAPSQQGDAPPSLGFDEADENGFFEISYVPPSDPGAVVYAIADGPESAYRMATVLGGAPLPKTITINERTTVATAYAMSQFLLKGKIAGLNPGLMNAAMTLRNLVDLGTGDVGPILGSEPNCGTSGSLPLFNALANLLAGCFSSDALCDQLFELTTPPNGGTKPGSTLQAAHSIAQYSWHKPMALYQASLGYAPYQPALTSHPVTWTLALEYVVSGLDGPGAAAIDAEGNVWVNNNYDAEYPHCASERLFQLTPTGFVNAIYNGSSAGLSGAGFGIGLDPSGDVWVGNFGFLGSDCQTFPPANSVSRFAADGTAISPSTGYDAQGCVTAAQATVSDTLGNIWIANQCGGTVTQYRAGTEGSVANPPSSYWVYDIANARVIIDTGTGTSSSCPEFSGEGAKPFAIAIDPEGNAWVTNNAGNEQDGSVIKLSVDGKLLGSVGYEDGIQRPLGISSDSQGNVWVSNSQVISLPCIDSEVTQDYCFSKSNDTGVECPLTPGLPSITRLVTSESGEIQSQTFTGGGLYIPWGNAVDGNDDVWVANFGGYRVSHFTSSGEPVAPRGYHSDLLERITGVSIDPSGNVWLINNWHNRIHLENPGGNSLVVFVGLATPVETPLIGGPEQ
ncbi:MAG: hypothetical protein AAF560_32245 [Acidobacteriota bacterium]